MYILIALWITSGIVGYFLMRQGFLVDHELSLGKKRAWRKRNIAVGMLGSLYGPVFLLMAFMIKGASCLKRRAS